MFIYVRGVESSNKGAELMALAAVSAVRQSCPSAKIAAPEYLDFNVKAKLGLYQRVGLSRWLVHFLNFLFPKSTRKLVGRFGFCFDHEFDLILDASGFALGNVWGAAKAEKSARDILAWKRQGAAVVLLPQAFGPFTSPRLRKAMKAILKLVDLAYARDEASLMHLKNLNTGVEKIRIAPDFTSLVEPTPLTEYEYLAGRVCLSPNMRLLDKTDINSGQLYLAKMREVISWLNERAIPFFILIHEQGDRPIAERLVKEGGVRPALIEHADPQVLKSIIGKSRAFIGSRYHAILGALYQGVPTLTLGWSHKYPELMEAFDLQNHIIKLHESTEQLNQKLEILLKQFPIHIDVSSKTAEMKNSTKMMWTEIFNLASNFSGEPQTKVFHITTIHPYNDPRIFHKECKSLADAGYEVTLLAPVGSDFTEASIKVRALGTTGRRSRRLMIMIPRALRLAITERPKICHLHDPELLLMVPLLRLFGIKTIYDVHEDYRTSIMCKTGPSKSALWLLSRIFGIIEGVLAKFGCCVLAERYYSERFPQGTLVLNYPKKSFEQNPVSAPFHWNLNPRYQWLFYSGSITEYRGAMNHLRLLRLNPDTALFMIGMCRDDFYQTLMKAAAEWGIESHRIQIIGRGGYTAPEIIRDATFGYPWAAGLALFPSNPHYERKELTKFFEYMSAGLPILASHFPDWRLLIEGNGTGVTVDPNDEPAILEKLTTILRGEIRLRAAHGPEVVREKYNFDSEAKKLSQLYARILKTSSSTAASRFA